MHPIGTVHVIPWLPTLLTQATTLNVAVNASNKALLTIMMSNNVSDSSFQGIFQMGSFSSPGGKCIKVGFHGKLILSKRISLWEILFSYWESVFPETPILYTRLLAYDRTDLVMLPSQNAVFANLNLSDIIQSGAAYHSQGFEDKNFGSSPGLLGQ